MSSAARLRCDAARVLLRWSMDRSCTCCYGASSDHRCFDEASPLLLWSIARPPVMRRLSCNATPMAKVRYCLHGPRRHRRRGRAAMQHVYCCDGAWTRAAHAAMEHRRTTGASMKRLPCCYGASPDHR
ncbi:hypothetical protein D1007_03994 [Hordeum vulgare]|nr:hypothetical protein D1007_03994 [Hordeum vulgare]